MDTYRVAIIGTGGIAHHHAGYYANNPRTEIIAGCDINPEHLQRYCDEYGVEARYDSHETMLAEQRPDIVSVCTWQESHPRLTIAAAEAGVKGVICEKPLGIDMAGPDAMVAACRERGVALVVHHQTRYQDHCAAARKAVAEGAIGEPIGAFSQLTGGLTNIASHTIDISRYVLGDPMPQWVIGQAQRKTNRFERGAICEDMCMAIVGLDNGARIQFDVDLPGTEIKVTRLILGTEGRISLDSSESRLLRAGSSDWEVLPTEPPADYLDEFLAMIETGAEHRCDISHGMVAHEVMMALYESSRSRALVELPLERRGCALDEMVADGTMPAEGPAYDIRIEEALRYYHPDA